MTRTLIDGAVLSWLVGAPPGPVVVACSGGLDSTVLARVAAPLLLARGHRVVLAHLDHGLRSRSAQADARFVTAMASELSVPCVRARRRPSRAAIAEVGIQAAARSVRRAFLEGVARTWSAGSCFLAHHRDDQAETVRIQQRRSRRAASVVGMPARSGLFVRPFLDVSRQVIRDCALDAGWAWREDPSNRDPRYLRVRVRAEPLRPSDRAGLVREALNRRQVRTYVHGAANRAELSALRRKRPHEVVFARSALAELEEEVAVALLQRHTQRSGRPPTRAALKNLWSAAAEPASGGRRRLDLGAGLQGMLQGDEVRIGEPRHAAVPGIGVVRMPGTDAWALLRARRGAGRQFAVFDGAARPLGGFAGHARRMRPFGGPGSRPVRDLMADAGVPEEARSAWPVAELASGEILWIPGVRASALHPLREASSDAVVLYTIAPRAERHRGLERNS